MCPRPLTLLSPTPHILMIRTFVRRTPARIATCPSTAAQSIWSTRFHTLAQGRELGGGRQVPPRRLQLSYIDKKQSARSLHLEPQPATSCPTVLNMTISDTTKPLEDYRLPLDVKPTHYDVTVRTDLEKLSFDGFVKIEYV
jgi:hypothetical protein